jgi:hypothetical protein
MSVEALNHVRAHRFGSPSRKHVMSALADYADRDWSTYVGQARLAAETELSERTVRGLIAELRRDGLLRHEPRYGKARGRRADRLVLVAAAIAELPASVAARTRRPRRPIYRQLTDPIYRQPTVDLSAADGRSTGNVEPARVQPTVNLREPSRSSAGIADAAIAAGGFVATLAGLNGREPERPVQPREGDNDAEDRGAWADAIPSASTRDAPPARLHPPGRAGNR